MAKAPAKVRGRYTGALDTGRSRVAYAAGRLKTAAMLLTRIVSLIHHGKSARESPRPLHRRLRHRALPRGLRRWPSEDGRYASHPNSLLNPAWQRRPRKSAAATQAPSTPGARAWLTPLAV